MNSKTDRMLIDPEGSEFKVMLPGEPIDLKKREDLKLGPGLRQTQDSIICIKAGMLKTSNKGKELWVESNQRRVRTFI